MSTTKKSEVLGIQGYQIYNKILSRHPGKRSKWAIKPDNLMVNKKKKLEAIPDYIFGTIFPTFKEYFMFKRPQS